MTRFYYALCSLFVSQTLLAGGSLFAKPGRMVPVAAGSELSMYCVGHGKPTIILESGFGGGTAKTWMRLQPILGEVSRTCSYDRAGYGFSRLGSNLPRDLNRTISDLTTLLKRSGEKPPYVLVGHSMGGSLIGAYADLYPSRTAALVFLDDTVVIPDDAALGTSSQDLDPSLRLRLDVVRRCLSRSEAGLIPAAGDACVDTKAYSTLPADLAAAEISNLSKSDYWRAYLSEAENNYSSNLSAQARALLPHKWAHLPVRVFVASASMMSDEAAAKSFGLSTENKDALTEARANRAIGEARQQSVPEFATNCRAILVPTGNHLVHDEALLQVVGEINELVVRNRRGK